MSDRETYFRIVPRYWEDMLTASDDAKLLGIYLLTCRHRSYEGLHRLPRAYIAADLEWSAKRLVKPLGELVERDVVNYDDNAQVCLIVKALKVQPPANPNQVTSALRRLTTVPATPLATRFRALAEQYAERLAERLPQGFGQPVSQPSGQPPNSKLLTPISNGAVEDETASRARAATHLGEGISQ